MYGAKQAVNLCLEIKAETILLLNDFWMIKNYKHPFSVLPDEVNIIAYIPLDGDIDDPSYIEKSLWLDDIILYNNHAHNQVIKAIEKLSIKKGLSDRSRIHVIPHGVDYETFYRLSSSTARRKIFSAWPHYEESLFILNANRYNERKDLESSLQMYAQSIPYFNRRTYFVLHIPQTPPILLEKLKAYIVRLGISEHVIINPCGEKYIDDAHLNMLYNACEIGINTSMGEGWGMVTFEHALTGAAQIVPDHTACGTLWKSHGEVISAPQPIKLMTNPFVMYKSDAASGSETLIQLVNNPRHLEKSKKRCAERAQSIEFSWARIGTEWMEILAPVTVQ